MNESMSERRGTGAPGDLPQLVFALSPGKGAEWQQALAAQVRAAGLCDVIEVGVDDLLGFWPAYPVTAIVDLAGRLDPHSHPYAAEGVWRLCDGRGVVLGAPHHGAESIADGVGARLHLVAHTRAGMLHVESAAAFADPCHVFPLQRLCSFAQTLLLGAVREIAELGTLDMRAAWTPDGKPPTWLERQRWKARGAVNLALRLGRGFLLVEQWMVGVVDMRVTEAVHARQLPVKWLGKRFTSHCWADPFGVPGSGDEIYCEEFDFRANRGRIVKLRLGDTVEPGRSEPVDLGLTGHLSYPYIFRHEGQLYCVAESAECGRCVLNRQDESGRWQAVSVLFDNAEIADPTIFRHGGYFWLAYTDVRMGAFDNLCLAYATDLLGPWQLHPQNPVKIDHWSSRSAGSVVRDGEDLLRTAQVCKTGYGQAVAINRIVHCTPRFYREETVRVVGPGQDRLNPHGLHTISEWGDRILVDGKRYVPNHWVVWRRIVSRLARAWRAPALRRVGSATD